MNRYVYIALALAGLTYGVFWYKHLPDAPVGIQFPATPAPEVAKAPTEFVDFAPIKVFKPEVKKRLKLSPQIHADTHAHVIASSKTANDGRQHTITTLGDDRTGQVTTYDRVEPLPWLAINTSRHYGAYIGALDGQQAIAVTARQEALRIKGVSVEAIAIGAMSQSERMGFVGVGVSW